MSLELSGIIGIWASAWELTISSTNSSEPVWRPAGSGLIGPTRLTQVLWRGTQSTKYGWRLTFLAEAGGSIWTVRNGWLTLVAVSITGSGAGWAFLPTFGKHSPKRIGIML